MACFDGCINWISRTWSEIALKAILIAFLLNIFLPSLDVVTDMVFFVGNVYDLHVESTKDVTRFKSHQEFCKLKNVPYNLFSIIHRKARLSFHFQHFNSEYAYNYGL